VFLPEDLQVVPEVGGAEATMTLAVVTVQEITTTAKAMMAVLLEAAAVGN